MSILEPGAVVAARYQVLSLLGAGGFGEVWRARKIGAEAWDKTVALKVLIPVANSEQRQEVNDLFIAEARIAAKLSHPNVVTVNEFGLDEKRRIFYIEMPFIDGRDLSRILRWSPHKRLPLRLALHVAEEFLKGLDYIHRQGYVYRDIKVENVLVSVEGAVLLADFGVAKQTNVATQMVKGTIGYIAPELYRARAKPNARSDLFAFGVLLYRTITGHPLFAAEDLPQAYATVNEGSVPPLASHGVAAPEAVDSFIRKLLAVAPERRPESANAARQELIAIPEARAARSDDLVHHLQSIGVKAHAEGATQMAPLEEPPAPPPAAPTVKATPPPQPQALPVTAIEPPRSRRGLLSIVAFASIAVLVTGLVLYVKFRQPAGPGPVTPPGPDPKPKPVASEVDDPPVPAPKPSPWDTIVTAQASGSLDDLDSAVRAVFPDHKEMYTTVIRVTPNRVLADLQADVNTASDGTVFVFASGQYLWPAALSIHDKKAIALIGDGHVEIYVKMGSAVLEVHQAKDIKLIGLFLNHYGPATNGWKNIGPPDGCGTILGPNVAKSNVVQIADVTEFGAYESELDGSGFIGLLATRSSGSLVRSTFIDCLSDGIQLLDNSDFHADDIALFKTGSRNICDNLKLPKDKPEMGEVYECSGSSNKFPSAIKIDETSKATMSHVTLYTPSPYKDSYALRIDGALHLADSVISHVQGIVGAKEKGKVELARSCVTTAVLTARATTENLTTVDAAGLFAPPGTALFDTTVANPACKDYGARLRQPLIIKRAKPTGP